MTTKDKLDKLITASNELNLKTEQLNEYIIEFEEFLEDAGIGVGAWSKVPLSGQGEEDWLLGYAKLHGKWRIAVRRAGFGTLSNASTPMPLVNAARILRLEAVQQMQELVDALTEKTNEYIADINALHLPTGRAVT